MTILKKEAPVLTERELAATRSNPPSNTLFSYYSIEEQIREDLRLGGTRESGYKDSLDIPAFLKLKHDGQEQLPKNEPKFDDNGKTIAEYGCATWGIEGECDRGHHFVKAIICNKEWCPDCGPKGSFAHKRRIARLLPRAKQMEAMGYFVIEKTLAKRHEWRDRKTIQRDGCRIRKALKVWGFKRGIYRMHWFGDPDENGNTRGWNPHANCLVDGAYLTKQELRDLKAHIRKYLKDDDLIIHYTYVKKPAKMYNKVKYVTRATFLNESWDMEMANMLRGELTKDGKYTGFRTTQHWGSKEDWQQPIAWELDKNEPDKIQSYAKVADNKCVFCDSEIHWKPGVVSMALVQAYQHVDLGAGFYYLGMAHKETPDPLIADLETGEILDHFFVELAREERKRGLLLTENRHKHIKCHPGQMEYEYLSGQGEELYNMYDEYGKLYMDKYLMAMSRFDIIAE